MPPQARLPLWFLIVNCSVIALAFAGGLFLGSRSRMRLPQPQATALQLIHDEILRSHVEEQDPHELLDRAIQGMVKSLDDYSRYVPPGAVAHYEEVAMGRYEGVGMVMMQHGDDVVIHFPFVGGPAEKAGLLPGDRILAVDGHPLAEITAQERFRRARDLIRGPAHTSVEVTIGRNDGERTVSVSRAAVQRPVVKWVHRIDPGHGIGYLLLTDFHRGIASRIERAIADLREEGPLNGLVLDLRFDGGGSLDECVALCRMFQPEGVIVSTRRRGEELERIEAKPELCLYPKLPLVVLVNGDSASASEVLSGCLQDHHRATIVGERTFGKGVVNTVYSWQEFKLKLTTAHFYTPAGRSLGGSHRKNENGERAADAPGIVPDIPVPATDEERRAIYRRLSAYEVPERYREAFEALAARYDGIEVPRPPSTDGDPQLAAAVEAIAETAIPENGK